MSAKGLPEGASDPFHTFGRGISKFLVRPAFRVRVHGAERIPASGPVVFMANHSSMTEPALLFGMLSRRTAFLVKAELFKGFVGWFFPKLGQIPVKRGAVDRKPLMAAVKVLEDGGAVGIFPEGTRGLGDAENFERGVAFLVRAGNATVVPVATRGTYKPAGAKRRWRPRVDIMVGEPFTPEIGKGRTGLEEGTERLRIALADLVKALDEWRLEHGLQDTRQNVK
ncbi:MULTISPECIES: lysophospholipid acyltransferase family protein [Amycolatopsis]|uniref:lysophospholipid acyltransferase family protein n=1 Tax=Amycolatopsis TaxID=1813 RepID=UPI00093FD933|nr:lysophospholipid acyltransferase family protein [Amycolatopsis sp. CB00013]OKK01745.1 acyl-phosphate glycerol 3-phosphate acyltransferase [Amycolatopsis sp. CB00013]